MLPNSQAAVASLRFQFPLALLGTASLTMRSDPYLPKSASLTTRGDPYLPKYDFLDAPRNFSELVAGHLAHRENILLRQVHSTHSRTHFVEESSLHAGRGRLGDAC